MKLYKQFEKLYCAVVLDPNTWKCNKNVHEVKKSESFKDNSRKQIDSL